jgi:hypothetical protein
MICSQKSGADSAFVASRTAKVAGKKNPNAAGQDQNNGDDLRQYGHEFEDENRKVVQDLDRALRSRVRENGQSRRSAVRLEAAKRLQEKVDTAGMQILDQLETAAEGPDHCAALVRELDYLRPH